MKNSIILLLSVIILAISNPKRETHVDTVKREFLKESEARKNQRGERGAAGAMEALGQGLALALGGSVMELLLEGAEYRDWVVGSALVIERRGDNKVLTVGALGQVFVLSDGDERR